MTDLRKVYTEIPEHYERVNRLITLGLDRLWRRLMIEHAIKKAPGGLWLDMCTGTGEIALMLQERCPDKTRVLAADYSHHMISQFNKKAHAGSIPKSLANAYELPFQTNSLSLITTSFATRNLHQSRDHLTLAFKEFHRVLKPGGLYISIESSRPSSAFVDYCFRKFVHWTVEPIGRRISGTGKGYAYLSSSIRNFYYPHELADILKNAGFGDVKWKRLFPGAVAVHTAAKYHL